MAAGLIVLRIQAVPGEGRHQPAPAAAAVAFALPTQPPNGAILLFTGQADQMHANWYQRYTTHPADWTVDQEGVATPKRDDITSKQEFGDCFVHVEFRTPQEGGGNSGVGLQGRYEIQIFNSYGREPGTHGCGALYSQKPPRVNASKPPGQWQSFDILFRAPRFNDNGQLTEKPRATVFQNGVLIQNNEEFTGMTGIQYGEYKEMAKTGPLVLQGDHDRVQFRNVWIVPL
ncbi:MAG TPA: DUF1080 domain-containing protein [Chthonomonadaceae bacterium]|nr:DUF1080 domain-containing protein [Chthonomonadaceae bacterium]